MPVYFGVYITIIEAFRIFNIDTENVVNEILNKYNCKRNDINLSHTIPILNKYFLDNSTKIRFIVTIEGRCIIGYEIYEPYDLTGKTINKEEFINLLTNLNTIFIQETTKLNADLSNLSADYISI